MIMLHNFIITYLLLFHNYKPPLLLTVGTVFQRVMVCLNRFLAITLPQNVPQQPPIASSNFWS